MKEKRKVTLYTIDKVYKDVEELYNNILEITEQINQIKSIIQQIQFESRFITFEENKRADNEQYSLETILAEHEMITWEDSLETGP